MPMLAPMPDDPSPRRRRDLVRALACAVASLMVATIVLSAYMRLTASGLGCAPWPACFVQTVPAQAGEAASQGVAWARLAHRVVASLVLVLTLLLVLATRAARPRAKAELRAALTLLLLTLALAVLGVTMRGSTAPTVVLGNLLGGFLMLAVATRLAWPAPAAPRALATLTGLALALLLVQIALGAMLSASRAAFACEGLSSCVELAVGEPWRWSLLDPWNGEGPTAAARGAWLPLLHRGAALVLLPVLAALAAMLWRARRRAAATTLAALLLVQMLVGGLLATAGWPLPQVLAHNLSAALLLALLLRLA